MLAMVLFSKVSFLMLVVVFLVDDEARGKLLRHRLTRTRGQHQRDCSSYASTCKGATLNGIAFHHVSFPLDQN
jgi:hypothetical protein